MVSVCISSAWLGLALPLCKQSVSWVGMCPLFRFCANTVTHVRGVVLATLLSLLAVPVVDIDDRITISQGIPKGYLPSCLFSRSHFVHVLGVNGLAGRLVRCGL
ncbi:hypothetical protein EDB84DRAFT_1455431, partial [Lactarius hengduanensis]